MMQNWCTNITQNWQHEQAVPAGPHKTHNNTFKSTGSAKVPSLSVLTSRSKGVGIAHRVGTV